MQGEHRQRSEPRRAADREAKTAVELTQEFIEETRAKLDRLERLLWGRWLVVVVALVLAGGAFAYTQYRTSHVLDQLRQSRLATNATRCAITSAIAAAGKDVISPPVPPDTPFTKFLEAHGYPDRATRERQSAAAGRAYIRDVSREIEERLGKRGDRLINRDGTINCTVLGQLSGVPQNR